MKFYVIIIVIVLTVRVGHTQITDLEILNAFMFKTPNEVEQIADSMDVQVTFDDKSKLFITYNGCTKEAKYEAKAGPIYAYSEQAIVFEEAVIVKMVLRYDKTNPVHYKDYISYDNPKDTEFIEYEKKMGAKRGHLKVSSEGVGAYSPLNRRN